MNNKWTSFVLRATGIYNILLGFYIICFPQHLLEIFNIQVPQGSALGQYIGIAIMVSGIGYFIAAKSPLQHWPIILVGLLCKILGPISFLKALILENLPTVFGVVICLNDLILLLPFLLILYNVYKRKNYNEEKLTITEDEFSQFDDRKRARFINSLSGFKSANMIGTANDKGETNLSIVSSAFHLGANPALLGLIFRPDSSPRHTLDNIRQTHLFTLNHVTNKNFQAAHQTSARYSRDQCEFEQVGLQKEFLNDFSAPFVKESTLKISLEFISERELDENGTNFIIGKIKSVTLPKDCLKEDGFIDIERAGSVCVSGLDSYHLTTALGRLSYAKPNKKLEYL